MYDLAPTMELADGYAFEELGGFEGEEVEAFEELGDPGEFGDLELEAYRRRRWPARARRSRIRRPLATRRAVRVPRRPVSRSVVRRRPVRATAHRRVPIARSRSTSLARRRIPSRARRRRPLRVARRYVRPPYTRPRRVVRRYVYLPYPGSPGVYPPPAGVHRRPSLVLSRFLADSTSLRRRHIPLIAQIARHIVASWRTGRPIRTIRLVGHTDNRGSARYNRRLGTQRAQAVRNRLVLEINRLRPYLTRNLDIVTQTAGGTRPIASNRAPTGRALNHRVEILLRRT